MKTKYKKIVVLYGGVSDEREVSLRSGAAVANALKSLDLDVTLLDWNASAFEILAKNNFDAAVVMLHGGEGEDGTVQALLESLQIPYTGPGPTSCLLAMDKSLSKKLWQRLNIPTLPFEIIIGNNEVNLAELENKFQYPICIKAASLGSSIGVYRGNDRAELEQAIKNAKELDKKIIIEHWIDYKEYTIGIVNNKLLPSIWIESADHFYDYNAKYQSKSTKYHCPSGLNQEQETYLQKLAEQVFDALDCRSFGRVDFLCDKDQNFYVMELNTVPGMTERSLIPQAAAAKGINFSDIALDLLNNASLKNKVIAEKGYGQA